MSTDRSSREVKLAGDLAVALALTQQFQHFELGIRRLTQRAAFRLGAAGRSLLRPRGHDLLADADMSAQHIANGVDDLFRVLLFHDVAVSYRWQKPYPVRKCWVPQTVP